VIDLRSDTVTRPTDAMRKAMADAEVGDDGYGEDPTVNRLEEMFAARVGKESAVFVPSGTMGNQIALRLLGTPGTSVIAGRRHHIVLHEQGGAGVNGSYQLHTLPDDDGMLDPAQVAFAVEAERHHWPPVSLVCVEDTHMPSGGRAWLLPTLHAVADVGLPVHLDGARLWNAAVASGVSPAERAVRATTVMCCLSKGLGAPVGSLLGGPSALMADARAERKRLGGSMRQAGVIAAAGIVALEHHVDRLADDHARAHRLAHAVAERWPDAGLDPGTVETNCVVFTHGDTRALLAHLRSAGILAGTIAPNTVRFMTHLDVDDAAVDAAIAAIRSAP
jgi:threonine aldolase